MMKKIKLQVTFVSWFKHVVVNLRNPCLHKTTFSLHSLSMTRTFVIILLRIGGHFQYDDRKVTQFALVPLKCTLFFLFFEVLNSHEEK